MRYSLREAVVRELGTPDYPSFDLDFWYSFHAAEWNRALDWMDLSGLALYFWRKMKAVDARNYPPQSVQTRLARSYEKNCLRVEALREEAAALNGLFESAGIPHAVLKGFALVPDYCADPTSRTQYDHDYLIQPYTLARAEAVLQKAGYIPTISGEDYHIVYCRPASEADPPAEPIGLYSARLARPVELHIRLWEEMDERIDVSLPDDFMDRLRERSWLGFSCRTLNDEDSLIFQVLHAFRHILRNWCRLSTFLEISYYLRQRASDSAFWLQYQDRIANLRWLPEVSTVVFRLAQTLFEGSIPGAFDQQVDPRFSSVLDLWIKRYGLPGALANFRNNKNSLFLHREFVSDRARWTDVWRRRLFPFRRPHHLPAALANCDARRSGRKWSQCLHGLQRFKFHAYSAFAYFREYPQWQLLRKECTRDQRQVSRGVQGKADQRGCNSQLSPKAAVTQLRSPSAFRE